MALIVICRALKQLSEFYLIYKLMNILFMNMNNLQYHLDLQIFGKTKEYTNKHMVTFH